MENDSAREDQLLKRLRGGDEDALGELFSIFRERLKKVVHFRLDHRLKGRVAESDVLQDTYIRASQRLEHYLEKPEMPFFVWLRLLAGQQLVDLHRHHVGAEMRDARREISLHEKIGGNTSLALAAHLADRLTSPSRVFERVEKIAILEETLNRMNPIDREVIALRHFEELTSAETAQVLGIEKAAASKRYVRALQRLQQLMTTVPGFEIAD